MKRLLSNKKFFWIGALVSCILWASLFSFIKLGYSLMKISDSDIFGQILFAGYVFVISGIIGVIGGGISTHTLLFSKSMAPKKTTFVLKNIRNIFIIAILQTVAQYAFLYAGIAHTTAARGSIISATNVFISIMLSSLLFRQERLSVKKVAGCILGFAGIIFINLSGIEAGTTMSFLGDGLVFMSAFSVGLAVVLVKQFSGDIEPVMLSGWQSLTGGIVLVLCGGIGSRQHYEANIYFGLTVLYLAFASAIAYAVWCLLLKYHSVSKVTMYGMLEPVFGVIISALVLKEDIFQLNYVIALALVSGGIWMVNREIE